MLISLFEFTCVLLNCLACVCISERSFKLVLVDVEGCSVWSWKNGGNFDKYDYQNLDVNDCGNLDKSELE